MVSLKEDNINFDKLEDELHAAVDADARYWRENDAKFRAVNQKVASYEEFRDMVLAAHLKPLEKKDNLSEIQMNQLWNAHALASRNTPGEDTDTGQFDHKLSKLPVNGHEFGRDWRRLCKTYADKYNFLLRLGADRITKVFKTEISFGLLGDFICTLDDQFRTEHVFVVLGILLSLSNANRFSLSVTMLSDAEVEKCLSLFNKIVCCVQECKTDKDSEEDNGSDTDKKKADSDSNSIIPNAIQLIDDLKPLYGVKI